MLLNQSVRLSAAFFLGEAAAEVTQKKGRKKTASESQLEVRGESKKCYIPRSRCNGADLGLSRSAGSGALTPWVNKN
jgi:hypothetical protein